MEWMLFLISIGASELLTRGVDWLVRHREPSYLDELVGRFAAAADLSGPQAEAVRRWLDREDVWMRLSTATGDELVNVSKDLVISLGYELGPVDVQSADDICREFVASLPALLGDAAGIDLAQHRAVMEGLEQLKDGQYVLLQAISENRALTRQVLDIVTASGSSPAEDLPPLLRHLPMRSHQHFWDLASRSSSVAIRLAQTLAVRDGAQREVLKDLLDGRVMWFPSDDVSAVLCLAETAAVTGHADLAGPAFEMVAGVDPARAGQWRALSLYMKSAVDRETAIQELEVLKTNYPSASRVADAFIANSCHDFEAAIEATREVIGTGGFSYLDDRLRVVLVAAMINSDDPDALPAGEELSREHPDLEVAGVLLAEARLQAAYRGERSELSALAKSALQAALDSAAKLEAVGADPVGAYSAAAIAAMGVPEVGQALELASRVVSLAPGTRHAARAQTILLEAHLAGELQLDWSPDPSSFDGLMLRSSSSSGDERRDFLRQAVATASDASQLEVALRHLALEGELDDRIGELRVASADRATAIEGLALSAQGEDHWHRALPILRSVASTDGLALWALVQLYERMESAGAAIDLLTQLGTQQGQASHFAFAADVALRQGRSSEALALLKRAAALEQPGSSRSKAVKWEIAAIVSELGDTAEIESAVRELEREGETSSRLNFMRAQVHLSRNQLAEAYAETAQVDADDIATVGQAVFYLRVALLAGGTVSARTLIELCDRFGDNEDARGLACHVVLSGTVSDASADGRPDQRLAQLIESFTQEWPESSWLRSVTLPTDPGELRSALADLLAPTSDETEAERQLDKGLQSASLPAGFVAAAVGASLVDRESVSKRIGWVSNSASTELLDLELRSIEQAVAAAGGAVVDCTTLLLWSLVPEMLDVARQEFSTLSMEHEQQLEAIATSVRQPPSANIQTAVNGEPLTIELSSEAQQAAVERRSELGRLASELGTQRAQHRFPEQLKDLDRDALASPWASAIRLSVDRDAVLISDDLGASNLARSLGCSVVSSYALLEFARRAQYIDDAAAWDLKVRLLESGATDLPITFVALQSLLQACTDPLTVFLGLLARPTAWVPGALDFSGMDLLSVVPVASDDDAGSVLVACLRGMQAATEHPVDVLVATAMASMILRPNLRSYVGGIVAGARAYCHYRGLDDPLGQVVDELIAVARSAQVPDVARAVLWHFEEASASVREEVAARLLVNG